MANEPIDHFMLLAANVAGMGGGGRVEASGDLVLAAAVEITKLRARVEELETQKLERGIEDWCTGSVVFLELRAALEEVARLRGEVARLRGGVWGTCTACGRRVDIRYPCAWCGEDGEEAARLRGLLKDVLDYFTVQPGQKLQPLIDRRIDLVRRIREALEE